MVPPNNVRCVPYPAIACVHLPALGCILCEFGWIRHICTAHCINTQSRWWSGRMRTHFCAQSTKVALKATHSPFCSLAQRSDCYETATKWITIKVRVVMLITSKYTRYQSIQAYIFFAISHCRRSLGIGVSFFRPAQILPSMSLVRGKDVSETMWTIFHRHTIQGSGNFSIVPWSW